MATKRKSLSKPAVNKRAGNKPSNVKLWNDENISDGSSVSGDELSDDDDEDSEEETANDKRKRLAKEYLNSVKDKRDGSSDNSDSDGSSDDEDSDVKVSMKLRKQRLESQGKYFRNLADTIEGIAEDTWIQRKLSGHENAVTCVALTTDDCTIYSGAKDNSLIKWDVESGAKTILKEKWNGKVIPRTQSIEGEVLSVAVSYDGKYIASGGRDNFVRIYDSRSDSEIKCFAGHRDAVSSLCFQKDTYTLFSGSFDRCVKHWDLNEMGYIETVFGHQDSIYAIDCWVKEKPVTSSGDRSVRLWKIAEESHLVFKGHNSSIDCVQYLMDDIFLSAGQDGSIKMWKDSTKKPIASIDQAHGMEGAYNPRWISSLACVKMTDLAVSGSCDGYARLWNVDATNKRIKLINKIPVEGFINGLAISSKILVAGTGREHRLGRWSHLRGNKNKIIITKLNSSS